MRQIWAEAEQEATQRELKTAAEAQRAEEQASEHAPLAPARLDGLEAQRHRRLEERARVRAFRPFHRERPHGAVDGLQI